MISDENKTLQVTIKKDLYEFLDKLCRENHISKSDFVDMAIRLTIQTSLSTRDEKEVN